MGEGEAKTNSAPESTQLHASMPAEVGNGGGAPPAGGGGHQGKPQAVSPGDPIGDKKRASQTQNSTDPNKPLKKRLQKNQTLRSFNRRACYGCSSECIMITIHSERI